MCKYIKNFFDKIYVVSLITHEERQKFIKNQFNQLGLDFEFVYGIDFCNFKNLKWPNPYKYLEYKYYKDNELSKNFGCAITHYQAVLYAYKHNYNNVLILEDDICLNKNFIEIIDFDNIPKDADFIAYDFRKTYQHEDYQYINLIKENENKSYVKVNDYKYFLGAMAYALMNHDTMKLYIENQHNDFVMSDWVNGIWQNWKNVNNKTNIYIPTKCIGIQQIFYHNIFIDNNYSYNAAYDNLFFRSMTYNKKDFFEPNKFHMLSRNYI